LLIRDENLRYAKAGFPTKIVESLACGTPPLCNYSSDLELYLEDKKNSIIANGHTSRDVYEAVKKALLITNENDRSLMRENSRKLALSSFDYSVYKDILSSICK
jgi:glycosyltransferase involved in cell wall biosynthesis